MLHLGNTARDIRKSFGVNQKEAARLLGITPVHLCNIEKNKSAPSNELVTKYREVFGIDLYVAAWCTYGDIDSLPRGVRDATKRLADAWRVELLQRQQGMRGRHALSSAGTTLSKSPRCNVQ